MKKTILTLAVMLMAHVSAWAQDDFFQYNGTDYATLEAAINAVSSTTENQVVTLIRDHETTTFTIPDNKWVVLDLGGKTLTFTAKGSLRNAGKLTIKDSGGDGKIVSQASWGIYTLSGATTVVEAGTIEAAEGCLCTVKDVTGATINVTGGVFNASDNAVLSGNGSANSGGNTWNISGGTFNGNISSSGYVACGIYAPNSDTWNVTGGTFNITGGAGIVQRSGMVNVSGTVTFNCTGNAVGKIGDSRVVVPCSPLVFDSDAAYPSMTDASSMTVTGGTFQSQDGVSVADVVNDNGDTNKRISISGGQFSDVVPEECCAVSYGPVTEPSLSGLYTVTFLQDVYFANVSDLKLIPLNDSGNEISPADAVPVIATCFLKPSLGEYTPGGTDAFDVTMGTSVELEFIMSDKFSADNLTVTVTELLTGNPVTTTVATSKNGDVKYNNVQTVTFTMPEGRAVVTLSYASHELTINTQDYIFDGTQKQVKVTSVVDETIRKGIIGQAGNFLTAFFDKEDAPVIAEGLANSDKTYEGATYTGKEGTVYAGKSFIAYIPILKKLPLGQGQTGYLRVGEMATSTDKTYYWNLGGLGTDATDAYFKIEFQNDAAQGDAWWGETNDPADATKNMTVKVTKLKGDVKISSVTLYDNYSGAHDANQPPSATGDQSGSTTLYTGKYREEPNALSVALTYQEAKSINWTAASADAGAGVVTFTLDDAQRVHSILIEYTELINSDDVTVTIAPMTYNGAAQMPNIEVKYGDQTQLEGTDYNIIYKSGDNPQYINAGTYVDEVRIVGTGGDNRLSLTASFTIQPKSIESVDVLATAMKTGSPITVTATGEDANVIVTDMLSGQTEPTRLVEGQDFTLTVNTTDIAEVGTYAGAVTITAKEGGNYTGQKTVDFIVSETLNIADATVTNIAKYTGAAQVPSGTTLNVYYGDKLLTEGTDYTLSYTTGQDYVNAQTYTGAVTLTGAGNYTGTKSDIDYVIAPRDINDADVSLSVQNQLEYTGDDLANAIVFNESADATTPVNILFKYGSDVNLTVNTDFTYTADPAEVIEPGVYTLTFTGKDNYEGTRTLQIKVVKNIGVDVELADQTMILPYVADELGDLVPGTIAAADIPVMDGDKKLVSDRDYTITLYNEYDATAKTFAEPLDANTITTDNIYWAQITYQGEFSGSAVQRLLVLSEYYEYDEADESDNLKNLADITLHLTGTTTAMVSPGTYRDLCVNPDYKYVVIPATATVVCGTEQVILDITGIEPNSFETGGDLRWVDATALPGSFKKKDLDRDFEAGTPFSGLAPQALVFIKGDLVQGENYVYKQGDEYRCAELKIYDDLSGTQTSFSEPLGESWYFETPYDFTAMKVTNTRMFSSSYYYTACLPYDLPFNSNDFKAYIPEKASDKLVGFSELAANTLEAYHPYVIVPEESGQLFCATNVSVPASPYLLDDAAARSLNAADAGNASLVGTMSYMDGSSRTSGAGVGMYILQSDKSWKKIAASEDNNYLTEGACILPMRAYISVADAGTSPSRLIATYTALDGTVTTVKNQVFDREDNSLYDLQGRRLQNAQRKGVYISNGRKVVVK